MYKPSRRALVVAASFALGLSTVAPAAHAGLLDGGSSDSPTVEGVGLPVGGDLLGSVLGGNLLGGDLLGSVLGGDVLGSVLGGDLLGNVLGGDGIVGDGLLGGGLLEALPVGDVLAGDSSGLLAGDGLVGLVPDLGILPGLGSINEILEAFSDSGSIVPGLQVLDEMGVLGALGAL